MTKTSFGKGRKHFSTAPASKDGERVRLKFLALGSIVAVLGLFLASMIDYIAPDDEFGSRLMRRDFDAFVERYDRTNGTPWPSAPTEWQAYCEPYAADFPGLASQSKRVLSKDPKSDADSEIKRGQARLFSRDRWITNGQAAAAEGVRCDSAVEAQPLINNANYTQEADESEKKSNSNFHRCSDMIGKLSLRYVHLFNFRLISNSAIGGSFTRHCTSHINVAPKSNVFKGKPLPAK